MDIHIFLHSISHGIHMVPAWYSHGSRMVLYAFNQTNTLFSMVIELDHMIFLCVVDLWFTLYNTK
jgi:hypothetical protein